MKANAKKLIVIIGATGLQGGAVARQLLKDGWRVRGLTRNAASRKAQALYRMGVDVTQGNLSDIKTLGRIFEGAYGVYNVQNPFISGPAMEIKHGKNVADAAKESDVQHLVYGSAGTGQKGTGIPSWETKLQVEEHMKAIKLPLTILRPMAFMELMTHKKFFPAVGTWNIMPALMGSERSLPWICTNDVGKIAARIFADPQRFTGHELRLASDVQSLHQCRTLYREITGKEPPRFPMPLWLFERFGFAGKDLTTMWRWLRSGNVELDTAPTRTLLPEALTVREWLSTQNT